VNPEAVEETLRKIFQLTTDVKCELIDRSRANKISYHVRFNIAVSYANVMTLLQTNGAESNLYTYIDTNIYATQFRITQKTTEFLYNP
jgi:hypothetical protein